MRLTAQVMRSRANGPLPSVEYLDLANLGIVALEKFSNCPKLQTLNLRGNYIYEVSNLDCCPHLWKLDLSNNQVKSLEGLTKFVALGTLNLANNDLSWQELAKLKHLQILDLSLHGNPKLEKDPYYRIHVADCLPNVWMLDGRIITAAERLQVKHFFEDSALTEHPIRHKLSKEWFVPSALKKIEVNGVFGDKTTHLMTRFPKAGPHNVDTDRRRLKYLAYSIQEDLLIEKKYTNREYQVLKYRKTFLEDLLDVRPIDRERCNMLLLLLVASLEFVMPTHLVKETLETAKLSKIGKVYTMDLFFLPRDVRCIIVCVMLSAVKVDKDDREDGGLYDKLYLCLFYTVAELTKLSHSVNARGTAAKSKLNTLYLDYKCLLASEVVQLLCIVPAFFEYADRDVGVMNMVVTATGDSTITDKISSVAASVRSRGEASVIEEGDTRKLYEEIAEFLLQKVQEQSMNLTNKSPRLAAGDQLLSTAYRAHTLKRGKSPVHTADYLAKGITSPNVEPPQVLSAKRYAERTKSHFPHLGDYLLLGPQTVGKIVSLPQPFVALVAMDEIPVANGAMVSKLRISDDHYTYVNMDQLHWDAECGFWKPKGSVGDSILEEFLLSHNLIPRFSVNTVEELQQELQRKANMSEHTTRPNSPSADSYPMGQDNTAPLIYSPRHPVRKSTDTSRMKGRRNMPRPMSSVLKEKLDLKLDFSRRAQSASAVDKGAHVPADSSLDSPSSTTTPKESLSKENVDPEDRGKSAMSDCLHCALEASMSDMDTDIDKSTDGHIPGESRHSCGHSKEDRQSFVEKSQNGHVSEVMQEDRGEVVSIVGSDDESELHDLRSHPTTARPASSTQDLDTRTFDTSSLTSLSRQSSSLMHVQIPQPEPPDSARSQGETTPDDKNTENFRRQPAVVTVVKGSPSSSARRPTSGRYGITGKNRPFTAVDAYRFFVAHPRKTTGTPDTGTVTSYQQQRTEAWRRSTHSIANPTPRQSTPPPQRPSSPDRPQSQSRVRSGVSVTTGNYWLAGGRDLYWESLQKRPKSGHVPGWKEGLPDNMKRPKSAVASRTLRRSRTTTPVTPSSLAYEAMLHEAENV